MQDLYHHLYYDEGLSVCPTQPVVRGKASTILRFLLRILSQIVFYITTSYYPKPKYLIVGFFGPFG